MRPTFVVLGGALLFFACKEAPAPVTPPASSSEPVTPSPPTAQATTPAPPPTSAPAKPKPGTRTTIATRSTDDAWDKMIVAGDRLWVLTNVTRWTSGPMYVPTARLWSVPVNGGELTKHLDLEGTSSLAADESSVYVAVYRDLSKKPGPTGRIVRVPLAGGAPSDVAAGIQPLAIAVDGDTLWVDDTRMPKDGSKPPNPSGAKGAMRFAFDAENVYFATPKGAGPGGDSSGGRVFRLPKKGGSPSVLAAKLPNEVTGLTVDDTHVYFCAVSWSSPEAERAGLVGRVPKGGGEVEILAKDQPALRKAWLHGGDVLFLSGRGGRPASVARVAKTGGAVTPIAADDTLEEAATDTSSLYFSSDGTFNKDSHARLTPANLVRVVLP